MKAGPHYLLVLGPPCPSVQGPWPWKSGQWLHLRLGSDKQCCPLEPGLLWAPGIPTAAVPWHPEHRVGLDLGVPADSLLFSGPVSLRLDSSCMGVFRENP